MLSRKARLRDLGGCRARWRHPQTLRIYERQVAWWDSGARARGSSRRYSDADIAQLRRIQELTNTGLNLEGWVKRKTSSSRPSWTRACESDSSPPTGRAKEAVESAPTGQYRRELVPLGSHRPAGPPGRGPCSSRDNPVRPAASVLSAGARGNCGALFSKVDGSVYSSFI